MYENKSIQKIYSVEYTLLHGNFVLEILKSLKSDIESTVPSEMNVSVESSRLNESDLDDTIQVVDKFEPQKPIHRGSGRKRKFPEKLGVPKTKI